MSVTLHSAGQGWGWLFQQPPVGNKNRLFCEAKSSTKICASPLFCTKYSILSLLLIKIRIMIMGGPTYVAEGIKQKLGIDNLLGSCSDSFLIKDILHFPI